MRALLVSGAGTAEKMDRILGQDVAKIVLGAFLFTSIKLFVEFLDFNIKKRSIVFLYVYRLVHLCLLHRATVFDINILV